MKVHKTVALIAVNILIAGYLLMRIDATRSPASAQSSGTPATLQVTSSGSAVYVLNGHRLYVYELVDNLKGHAKLRLAFSQEVGK